MHSVFCIKDYADDFDWATINSMPVTLIAMTDDETTTPEVSRSRRLRKKSSKKKEMEHLANVEDEEDSRSTNSRRRRHRGGSLSSHSRSSEDEIDSSDDDGWNAADDDEWNVADLSKKLEAGLVMKRREKANNVARPRWVPKGRKLKNNDEEDARSTNSKRRNDLRGSLSSHSRSSADEIDSSVESISEIDSSVDDEWKPTYLSKKSKAGLLTRRRKKATNVARPRWVPKERKLKKNDKEESRSTNRKKKKDFGRCLPSHSRSCADEIESSVDDQWNAADLSKKSKAGLATRHREKATGVACPRSVPEKRKLKKNGTTDSRSAVKTLSSSKKCVSVPKALPLAEPEWTPINISPSRTEESLGTMPLDVAAHLTLLGQNLLRFAPVVERSGDVGPGIYSALLDVLLCSTGSLICLTRQLPGLDGPRLENTCEKILDHIAYIMPCMEDDQ